MKNKKTIFIILGVTFVVLSLTLLLYLRWQFSAKTAKTAQIIPTPTIAEDLTAWQDQSGFTFQYPKNLTLDPHDEDEENYAHLELSSATSSGSLIVWAKDTTASDIDELVDQEDAKGFIDTSLSGERAKKILTSKDTQKISTSTIYNGYLYQIEADLADSDYWNRIYNTVSSSFRFIPAGDRVNGENTPQQVETSQDSSQGDTTEGEEVIE
ncbi:hypothetical protein HY945_03130 [Candidatus Gottesmanbacteria bacterium]|nr:hypothetical protein [Candidatus Gottesmanbacteria bacterium]